MKVSLYHFKKFESNLKFAFLARFVFLFTCSSTIGQSEIQLGINGLTCSLCCKTVEESIRKLDFVEEVKMDLINTMATVRIDDARSDLDKLVKAVGNAGFSVRNVGGVLQGKNWRVADELEIHLGKIIFQVLNPDAYQENSKMNIQYLSGKYLTRKEWKKISIKYSDKKMHASGHYILIL